MAVSRFSIKKIGFSIAAVIAMSGLFFGASTLSPAVNIEQAQAKASASAVKWLKGNWYTNGSSATIATKPRAMVRFTKTYAKYYGPTKSSKWSLYQKVKITKTKKTKKGYAVYLADGNRYEPGGKKDLYCKWGKNSYSGSSSLWRK